MVEFMRNKKVLTLILAGMLASSQAFVGFAEDPFKVGKSLPKGVAFGPLVL
ncbi:hypothetical protein FACS1894198_6130 [Clostridia bacterium]|nr:hypothetical protein FACS1894198_6130 [Clostridia bacterium]